MITKEESSFSYFQDYIGCSV